MTLKEAIKVHLDYVLAVIESNARWEERMRTEGDDE